MALRTPVRAHYFALLSALGLLPVAACGSDVEESAFDCTDSQPVTFEGQQSGYETCAEGYMHRSSKVTCTSPLPREATCDSGTPEADQCTTDADCTDQAHGYCDVGGFGAPGCYCQYGCVSDDDCADGQICLCGDPVGQCVPATCTTDADCAGELLCTTYITEPGCGGYGFACQTAADECATDDDCGSNQQCTINGQGERICADISCAIGRPFLVAGTERLADRARRSDWGTRAEAPILDGLSDRVRAALADHWTSVGLMEHASVAAFARFALQLLAQGAPPDLVVACQEAMADETRHARVAFTLASVYAGEPVGPGRLPIDGALEPEDAATILRLVVREGCIGETAAAIEAAEAAAHAADPVIRATLEGIAADEQRHAELAWRYVDWVLAEGDEAMEAVLRDEIEAAREEAVARHAEGEDELLRHGAVGEGLRRTIRRRALAEVIAPCADQLAAKHRARRLRRCA